MEQIITITRNELGQSKLGKATAFIIESLNNDVKNEKERAIKCHDVDISGIATKSNPLGEFDSTAAWAEYYFGWGRSKVSRYTRIVDRFHDVKGDNGERLTDGNGDDIWDNYSVSQMIELLNASDEQLQSITVDMSVRTIRDKLKMIEADGDSTDNDSTDNDSGDVIDVTPTYTEYKRTKDITELAATIRQFRDVNVEYSNGEYIIFTKATV